ncbi:VOC family protein [candidate division WWE3 bacterium]|nr:VOC family protein [candidate division WWE3 bacterium]
MGFIVHKYPAGTFSWVDFYSTDIHSSKQFVTKLLGWTYQDMPTEPGKPDYTMFFLSGLPIAGGSPTFNQQMPSFWSSYITVDNVDEMAQRAVENEGTVLMNPMDVMEYGRMATIQDPTGAAVSLWQPKQHIGAGIVNTVGAMCWNELYTKDVQKACDFYGKLFNWTFSKDPQSGYVTIRNKGRANGGMFELTPSMQDMPPCWVVYFTIADMNKSLDLVNTLGGKIYMDVKEIGVGKIAMVADSTGASFMLIQLDVPPEDWPDEY